MSWPVFVDRHARAPLGVNSYRVIFSTGGEVNTADLEELADESTRVANLAGAIVRTLGDKGPTLGRLSARDLWLMFVSTDELNLATEQEIRDILEVLASPPLGVLNKSDIGYVLVMNPNVVERRLRELARAIAHDHST